MADGQLAAHHGDDVTEIGTMTDRGEKRTILFINAVPIGALHLRIVEVFALDAPGLAIYVGPLGSRIDAGLEPGYIQRSVSNFCRSRSPDDSPPGAGRIDKFLFIGREAVRRDAFQERHCRTIFYLISLEL